MMEHVREMVVPKVSGHYRGKDATEGCWGEDRQMQGSLKSSFIGGALGG